MAYVAVKGGERAIDHAHAWLAEDRRGDPAVPEITPAQIAEQLGRAVDRVMAEGALYDPALAALVIDILGHEGLIEADGAGSAADPAQGLEPGDLTRTPLAFPAGRDLRLQALARGDEGFLLGLGYSSQRGWGGAHPFVGEIRVGELAVEISPPELGFAIDIGDVTLTECQMVNQFHGSRTEPAQFTRGYGLAFGHAERKAMAMALVDRAMRAESLGEDVTAPAQDVEFVLSHCDNIEATGFVEHLKLPHYVDFQSELESVRRMRAETARLKAAAE